MHSLRLRLICLAVLALLAVTLRPRAPAWAQDGGGDPDELEQGARLYAENCAVCHGPEGQGRVGATLAKDWPSINPGAEVRQTVVNGVTGSFMPAWSQANGGPLTDEQIDAVVAYVLSWQSGGVVTFQMPTPTAHPPITPVPDVEGDPNQGAVLYAENCAVCHGLQGRGRIGATLAKDWPSIRPDVEVKQTILTGVTGSFMPAWSQANGGPLTEEQIDDVVAYILSLSAPVAPVEPTATPTPTPQTTQGANTGLIVGAIVLVLIVIGGVIWASRKS